MIRITEDAWMNDVTVMIIGWLIATGIAGAILLTVGKSYFL